jgi:hypothetical protein
MISQAWETVTQGVLGKARSYADLVKAIRIIKIAMGKVFEPSPVFAALYLGSVVPQMFDCGLSLF